MNTREIIQLVGGGLVGLAMLAGCTPTTTDPVTEPPPVESEVDATVTPLERSGSEEVPAVLTPAPGYPSPEESGYPAPSQGDQDDPDENVEQDVQEENEQEMDEDQEGGTIDMPTPHPSPLVASAITDLAQRLSIDEREITLVSFENVTWRDGSLGCPQPGMMYTQALVDGTRIVLSANNLQFNYHTGGNRGPFLCERQLPGASKPTPIELDIESRLTPNPPDNSDQ